MLKLRVLIENSPPQSGLLEAEHGLSFWVELDSLSLIFDTGESGSFVANARKLGIELARAQALVVSHGHYDHGGGLRALAEEARYRGPLWTGPGFFDPKWSEESPKPRFLGLDVDRDFLESHGIEHCVLESSGAGSHREILPGIHIVGGFPRLHPEETIPARFSVERQGRRQADSFSDEICVVIDMAQGLAVLVGCAHPGLMNMLDTVRNIFQKPLCAVFGGSHLVEADEARMLKTIDYLKTCGARELALGHCTGTAASELLARDLPQFQPLCTGAFFNLA